MSMFYVSGHSKKKILFLAGLKIQIKLQNKIYYTVSLLIFTFNAQRN